jgi:hypothetical protein
LKLLITLTSSSKEKETTHGKGNMDGPQIKTDRSDPRASVGIGTQAGDRAPTANAKQTRAQFRTQKPSSRLFNLLCFIFHSHITPLGSRTQIGYAQKRNVHYVR